MGKKTGTNLWIFSWERSLGRLWEGAGKTLGDGQVCGQVGNRTWANDQKSWAVRKK